MYPKQIWEELRLEVGENNTIFDIAAGYGHAANFLHPSNAYYGIDINKHFVSYGCKKGGNLELKNIFDPAAYRPSDIFLAIDIVHHLSAEKSKELFNLVFQHAKKKVIIIDPAFVSIARKCGPLGAFLGWLFRVLDNDGFTTIDRWMSEREYRDLFQSRFGSVYGKDFEVTPQKIIGYHFVVFNRKAETLSET
ncbi:MAG: hypothetical protein A3J30_04295 [Candidatus Wildermuthbacteria bacterium RIFCSPLOWO2_02_FULL_47_9c]|uniref:Methyltransferase domain-containing protein n=2 Tax=Parcubacteria group TaxID=1794811 RepID=A0A837ILN0_9BACT|nr:MAG: hypothetical protein UY25_C0002G0093 [Candidatus Yanofskybacteria bacterium GW2011_GWC1_48_11]KKW04658.1 MAG: hypothetical protein UY38_C0001G0225 [Parcubacteria group bacterium GW2011_GWB1_49_12]KKW09041.1 MAG: hypothetical protein UY45_C0002G0093 [Parcubacteria group bacterium GW2011_GWA1_49_26]KKW13646.1 MAG: hypothetical protein UY53_C0010G0055 [Parcubacteria group bacterium GW2011_GWA2_50_10]OHA61090.1 MAG: hypothetical protein A2109_02460 [Candidatus Wildermuthbacteria bacterium G